MSSGHFDAVANPKQSVLELVRLEFLTTFELFNVRPFRQHPWKVDTPVLRFFNYVKSLRYVFNHLITIVMVLSDVGYNKFYLQSENVLYLNDNNVKHYRYEMLILSHYTPHMRSILRDCRHGIIRLLCFYNLSKKK